jgi:hypothetical protein
MISQKAQEMALQALIEFLLPNVDEDLKGFRSRGEEIPEASEEELKDLNEEEMPEESEYYEEDEDEDGQPEKQVLSLSKLGFAPGMPKDKMIMEEEELKKKKRK